MVVNLLLLGDVLRQVKRSKIGKELTMANPMLGTQEGALRLLGILGPLVEFLGEEIGGLIKDLFEKLSSSDGVVWLTETKKFLRKEACWVACKLNPYLRQITTGTLAATTGERTLAQAKKVFSGHLDPDFENWGTDVVGQAAAEALFEVHELTKDGTFTQIFGGFKCHLDQLCWSQDQIIAFVEAHSDLLHPEGYATFFLFKVGNEVFVAYVYRSDGLLRADVFRLSFDRVWGAGYRFRFVVPQRTI